MATEKPYTLANLIGTLAALIGEGALMVAGTTWLALHDKALGLGVAYIFAVLIALIAVGLGALQIFYYRQDKYPPEHKE